MTLSDSRRKPGDHSRPSPDHGAGPGGSEIALAIGLLALVAPLTPSPIEAIVDLSSWLGLAVIRWVQARFEDPTGSSITGFVVIGVVALLGVGALGVLASMLWPHAGHGAGGATPSRFVRFVCAWFRLSHGVHRWVAAGTTFLLIDVGLILGWRFMRLAVVAWLCARGLGRMRAIHSRFTLRPRLRLAAWTTALFAASSLDGATVVRHEAVIFGAAVASIAMLLTARGGGLLSATRDFRALCRFAALTALVLAVHAIIDVPFALLAASDLPRVTGASEIYGLQVLPGGDRLVFTTRGESRPTLVELPSGGQRVSRVPLGRYERIALASERRSFFVAGPAGTFEFGLEDFALRRQHDPRHSCDVAPIGADRYAITLESKNPLVVSDVANDSGAAETQRELPLPYPGGYLEYSAALGALYVAPDIFSPYLSRFDVPELSMRSRWDGYAIVDMCAFPERGELAVARPVHNDVALLDGGTLAIRRRLPVEFGARELECDSRRSIVYVLSHTTGLVSALDLSSERPLLRCVAGPGGRGLSYDAPRERLYVGTTAGIFVVDVSNARAIDTPAPPGCWRP